MNKLAWTSFYPGLLRDPSVRAALGEPCAWSFSEIQLRLLKSRHPELNIVVWGNKASGKKPAKLANKMDLKLLRLEEGVLAYLGHPAEGDSRFSLVLDRNGMYYDARNKSDFYQMLDTQVLDEQQRRRVKQVLSFIRHHKISKYNHSPCLFEPDLLNSMRFLEDKSVLVVDQSYGDASISGALADASSFERMLDSAVEDNPDAQILLKLHPDTLLGSKHGQFSKEIIASFENAGGKIIKDEVPTSQLLEYVEKVYTVSSQTGFEALIREKEVHCFGMPFYAGYGLTYDRIEAIHPRKPQDLETLAYCMFFSYTSYIDPESGQACELEQLLPLLAEQTKPRFSSRNLHTIGLSLWKRSFLKDWLPSNILVSHHRKEQSFDRAVRDSRALALIWGKKFPNKNYKNLLRFEDGFLRSKGLGVNLNAPLSLAFDQKGIYYDFHADSDLEALIRESDISRQDLEKARALRQLIVSKRVNKYNQELAKKRVYPSSGRKIILVPGQVDDDASIKYGSVVIDSSETLLKSVRAGNPDAFIVYRPHPDVEIGEREGLRGSDVGAYADLVESGGSILDSIEACDELHCLTSLAGFEALIRNKPVVCYGVPFYSGLGLTIDKFARPRLLPNRSIDELVYCSLIAYPSYLHPKTKRYSTAYRIVEYLADSQYKDSKKGLVFQWFYKGKMLLENL